MTELDEALKVAEVTEHDTGGASGILGMVLCESEEDAVLILQAARKWAELKRRVEAGECKVVPCELTKQQKIDTGCMDNYDFDYATDHACADQDHENWYKAALSAAPNILKQIEGE